MRRRLHKPLYRWCFYCDVQLTRQTASRDHVIPKSHGGRTRHTVDCCKPCNERKATMTLAQFRLAELGSADQLFPGELKRRP